MITIDELRKLGGTPRQGGMGVIKWRVSPSLAYHFYSGDTHEVRGTGIHKHNLGMTSTILKGELRNYIYEIRGVDDDSTLQLIKKHNKLNADYTISQDKINLVEACTFTTVAGKSYTLDIDTLHSIECVADQTITEVRWDTSHQWKTAEFVVDTAEWDNDEKPRPRMTEEECWEIVEDMLK